VEPMTSFAAERARRSAQVDRWLAELLGAEPDVALVAVGGYGRREMLPRSDLDVLLLQAAGTTSRASRTASGTRSGTPGPNSTTPCARYRRPDGWPGPT